MSDDKNLVARAINLHDKEAYGLLVVRYQAAVRRFFLGHTLGNESLSDDLAQDTFVKAWIHLSTFQERSSFSTWLFRIAYNVFYDHTRRSALRQTSPITQAAMHKADRGTEYGNRLDLYSAMSILKEEERGCISLQLFEGLPIDEIATITGMNPSTVKSHLARGKRKLAEFLKTHGYEERSKNGKEW